MKAILLTLVLAHFVPAEGSRSWCENEAATDGEVEYCDAAYPGLYAELNQKECHRKCAKERDSRTCEAECVAAWEGLE